MKLGISINPFVSDSLLSAINRTSQSASLSSKGKLEGQSSIEQSDVENAEQIAAQLHKPIRHKFSRRKVIVYKLDEIWACDLMEFLKDPIYHKRMRYNYMLVIIDCFSKFC